MEPQRDGERTCLELFGHPFSSYTWKVEIALFANDTPYAFRQIDGQHPDNGLRVAAATAMGKFPLLVDGEREIFESTAIIEYVAACRPGKAPLIPSDPYGAVKVRMIDRVFDNYVMAPMQAIVSAHMRSPDNPDRERIETSCRDLRRTYRWLEAWLADYPRPDTISLIECAAAPSLFYADWVCPLADEFPTLAAWRAQLLRQPAVSRSVEAARPYRAFFPPGAPDRD